MDIKTLLFVLLAVFASLFIALFQYIYINKEKSQLNYWLSFFRFWSVFLILLLIINPSIKKTSVQISKPNLLVAIDNSASIKNNSQSKAVQSLVGLFKNNKALNAKYSINYFSFGTNLNLLDSLNFNKNQTNLAIPFQEFPKLFTTKINPVVIITDGNQTIGNTIEFLDYKSPVFPFIVGDTTVFKDIYIKQLNTNKFTTINNKFPVELFINYTGGKFILKKLNVYHKGLKVYSKKINFSRAETTKSESFFLTAFSKGTQYYTAKIEELSKEQNTINNTKTFSINVIDEKAEILILTSIIHPDLGMFKKSIESNKQRSTTVLNINNFKGNISDYQLIIVYQPNKDFKNIFNEISTKKLHYFVVTGLHTDWNFLNKIQTNFSKKVIEKSENYSPVFNTNYTTFLSNNIGFSEFAPLEDNFGDISFSIPYNALLFQRIGTIETKKPLLATFESSNQRGAVLLGENIWRWRMNSFSSTNTFEYFDGFMSNLIQYLSSNQKDKRLSISVEPIYYANGTIQISAIYLDKNFNFDSRVKLFLTVKNKKNGFLNKFPFTVLKNRFSIELPYIVPGEYTCTVSVENKSENISKNFKILPFDIEQQFTNANDKELKIFAKKTDGKVYYLNQENLLINNLELDNRFKNLQKTTIKKTSLIDWKWILGFIILSLSIEWFLRKYFGMI